MLKVTHLQVVLEVLIQASKTFTIKRDFATAKVSLSPIWSPGYQTLPGLVGPLLAASAWQIWQTPCQVCRLPDCLRVLPSQHRPGRLNINNSIMNYWWRMHEQDWLQSTSSSELTICAGSIQLRGLRNWSPDQNQLLWQEQLASEIILSGKIKYYHYTLKDWLMAMLFRLVLPMSSWHMPPMSKNTIQVKSSFEFDSFAYHYPMFQETLELLGCTPKQPLTS